MSYSDEENFEQVGAEASLTSPKQCSTLRKGDHVVIKGQPCKIVNMSTSKTGKHGHAKVHIVGIDIFTGKKRESICPSTHSMDTPNVLRKEYKVVGIKDGYVTLMDDRGSFKRDLSLEKDASFKYEGLKCNQIVAILNDGTEEADIVAKVTNAMGRDCIMSVGQSRVARK